MICLSHPSPHTYIPRPVHTSLAPYTHPSPRTHIPRPIHTSLAPYTHPSPHTHIPRPVHTSHRPINTSLAQHTVISLAPYTVTSLASYKHSCPSPTNTSRPIHVPRPKHITFSRKEYGLENWHPQTDLIKKNMENISKEATVNNFQPLTKSN